VKPPNIVGFAAQRDEDGTGAIAGEFWPVVVEVLIHGALVKPYLFIGPALMPEFVFHVCSPFSPVGGFVQSNLILRAVG
jgi:hypothetical protein